MAEFQAAKFGQIALLITSHSDDDGRDWVTHSPARGDQHVLQERGRRLQRTRCDIVFCDEPNGITFLDRFLQFREVANDPRPQLFVHPVLGSYLAVVSELQHSVSSDERCVRVSCTFLAQDPPQAVFAIGAGVTAAAGPDQVGVYAAGADAELAELGLASTAPAGALATVQAWAELEDPDARAIALEAASIAGEIDDAVETLALATDLTRWAAYRQMINLRYSVVQAASATTSETARVTEITLAAAEPLRALCARLYGASEAEERARQVQKLNGLRTPGLVPAGTSLKLPALGAR